VILPILALNIALIGYPLLYLLYMSLNDYDVIRGKMNFVGLKNYLDAIQDPATVGAIPRTILFSATVVAASVLLGLAMALLLNEDFRGRSVLRTIVLVPWGVSEFATSAIWRFILSDSFGSLNGLLYALGLIKNYQLWLSEQMAIFWVAAAFAWHFTPLGAFFLLASLQTIPQDIHKAAKVDGAGPFRRFWNVTLPHIRYAVLIVLVLATMEAFRAFDVFYVMTGGGPGVATEVLTFHIYRQEFYYFNLGGAAATSYILTLIILVLAAVYFVMLTRRRRGR